MPEMADASSCELPMPVLAPLQLFGTPTWLRDDDRSIVFGGERRFQLRIYLACRHAWVSRDELAELLWPERPQQLARSNLRKVLLLAQQVPGLTAIEQQGDHLRWMPESDLLQFESACADRRWGDAISLYRPPLLAGWEVDLPAGLVEWLAIVRERVAARWRDAAEARLAELSVDPRAAAALATTLLEHDPVDDHLAATLAEAHLALGEAARGLRALDAHTRRLAVLLGVGPSEPLRALMQRLRERLGERADAWPAPMRRGATADQS